ncbi:glutathione S-transferase family protein [Rhizobium sp. TRM95796]|uniref:glutathione S-transferase family protein n=1 Tax=Rhizobium sp. TRM95796 TaxID=2979862 RepID=UPI0021E7DC9F|nr:glutathione S-transferase family protein [Rhizobium sp. TRM95796]MCV3766437.1 glutathione S-transferase family protein [Rhizobium sp. TRM95796]
MLTIYGVYQSRASRVYWTALELGLDFESVPVIQTRRLPQPVAPDAPIHTHAAEFLAINPNGHIPAIADDGLVIDESLAITLYLARKHGGPIAADTLREEGEILAWTFWAATEVEPHTVKIVFAYDDGLEATEGGRETISVARRMLKRPLTRLNDHLGENDYLTGGRFTVADLNVVEIIRYALSETDFMANYPAILAWVARCHERPAFREMMARRKAEG